MITDVVLVQSGDVVGWYMPDRQTIPFNEEGRHLLVRRVYGMQGAARRLDMSSHELGWCRTYSLRAIVRPTPGERILVDNNVVDVRTLHNKNLVAVLMARFFGHHPVRRGEADTGSSMHFVTEYAFDVCGHVIRWELYSNAVRIVQLQIWRPVPEAG